MSFFQRYKYRSWVHSTLCLLLLFVKGTIINAIEEVNLSSAIRLPDRAVCEGQAEPDDSKYLKGKISYCIFTFYKYNAWNEDSLIPLSCSAPDNPLSSKIKQYKVDDFQHWPDECIGIIKRCYNIPKNQNSTSASPIQKAVLELPGVSENADYVAIECEGVKNEGTVTNSSKSTQKSDSEPFKQQNIEKLVNESVRIYPTDEDDLAYKMEVFVSPLQNDNASLRQNTYKASILFSLLLSSLTIAVTMFSSFFAYNKYRRRRELTVNTETFENYDYYSLEMQVQHNSNM